MKSIIEEFDSQYNKAFFARDKIHKLIDQEKISQRQSISKEGQNPEKEKDLQIDNH